MPLLTAQQISEVLQRPASTTRFWGAQFRDFLPRKKRGRFFAYPEPALEIFKRIAELSDRGLFKDEIIEQLEKDFGTITPGEEIEDEKPATKEIVLASQFQNMMSVFAETQQRQDRLITAIEQQNQSLVNLIELLVKKPLIKKPASISTETKTAQKRASGKKATKKKRKPVKVKKGTPKKKTISKKKRPKKKLVKKNWFQRLTGQ